MLALGSVQEVVERQIRSGNVNFDMAGFMNNVVLSDVANPGKHKRFTISQGRSSKSTLPFVGLEVTAHSTVSGLSFRHLSFDALIQMNSHHFELRTHDPSSALTTR